LLSGNFAESSNFTIKYVTEQAEKTEEIITIGI